MKDIGSYKVKNLNRRHAIHEKCLDCAAGHYKEVTNCSYADCSLHPFRILNCKQNPAQREKAIRKYCLWCTNGQVGEVTKCPSHLCPLYMYRKEHREELKIPTSHIKILRIGAIFGKNEDKQGKSTYASL
jgi:hypothetical protein